MKKGMSLVEVIIAVFLIGLIASMFLPSMTSSFTFMSKAKNITINIFKTQNDIERDMEEGRDNIDKFMGTSNDPRSESITVFERNISYIPISVDLLFTDNSGNQFSRGRLNTIVANGHVVEENMPKVSEISTNPSTTIYVSGSNSISGNHTIQGMVNYLTELKNWYVSSEGLDGYMPNISDINEIDLGYRYPSWPKGFELVQQSDSNILSNLNNYIGRYIAYTVIPVSKTGKYGEEVSSKPIYIRGLPVMNNLKLHLDSYAIESKDNVEIKEWKNLADNNYNSSTGGKGFKLAFNNGKYGIFDGTTLNISKRISLPNSSNQMTVFMVFNNLDENINQTILSKLSTSYGWDIGIENNKLKIQSRYSSTNINSIYSDSLLNKDKYIVTIKFANSSKIILDKDEFTETIIQNISNRSLKAENNALVIGGSVSKFNLSEVIIYDTALSDDDINKTREFLAAKHRINLNLE